MGSKRRRFWSTPLGAVAIVLLIPLLWLLFVAVLNLVLGVETHRMDSLGLT